MFQGLTDFSICLQHRIEMCLPLTIHGTNMTKLHDSSKISKLILMILTPEQSWGKNQIYTEFQIQISKSTFCVTDKFMNKLFLIPSIPVWLCLIDLTKTLKTPKPSPKSVLNYSKKITLIFMHIRLYKSNVQENVSGKWRVFLQ